jgi:threonine synthase
MTAPVRLNSQQGYTVYCLNCGAAQAPEALRCAVCSGSLAFRYERDFETDAGFPNSMWRYWRLLPVGSPGEVVTLQEGGTPLLASRAHPARQLWYKDETRNPTGSHKDRALAVALSHAKALGCKTSVVVSSGSTGIANAAASARAGIQAVVVVARGVPEERLYPAYALGAHIIEVDAEVDTIVERVGELGASGQIYVSSTARSSNPYQAEGSKTIAYEIVEQLGAPPDWVVVPVGGGGTVAGVWRGFEDLRVLGRIDRCPRILGVVARGYDAIARALHDDLPDPMSVFGPEYVAPPTILVKIAHVYPPDGVEGLAALRDSGGVALVISEPEALEAQRRVAAEEGLYVEPSSAAAVAAYAKADAAGTIAAHETVVVLMSGSGFRETFVSSRRQPLEREVVTVDQMPDLLLDLQQKAM